MRKSIVPKLMRMMAIAVAAVTPALAQEVPASAEKTPPPASASTVVRPSGAASSSYARCAPGNPIGGIIVKGGHGQVNGAAASETDGNCPAAGEAQAAEARDGRTYTGGRRNADVPSAMVEAGAIAPVTNEQMPSRLSMTPTTVRTTVEPPAPADKSISEKGVAASKPSKRN